MWKKDGEGLSDRLVQGTKKFGGGSLMWGCMTWEGAGWHVGLMERWIGFTMSIFWMRNFKKARMTLFFSRTMTLNTLAKRPNNGSKTMNIKLWAGLHNLINPIEHLWHHLKRRLAEYDIPPKGILELWDRVEEEWNKIPSEVCHNLIESMPRHVEAVIKAKGGYTKY